MKYFTLIFLLFFMSFCKSLMSDEGKELLDPKIIPIKTRQPEEKKIYPIAIIGAGASGTMAVKRAVLNNNEVLLFAGAKQERRRSRGNWVRCIDNVPGLAGYQRTILELRNEVLEKLAQHPLGNNLYVIEDSILSIKNEADFFELTDGSGRSYYAKYIVLAMGMMDEQPHIQGTIKPILKYANGQTAAYCSLCDGHRSFGKKAAVIGYSESAALTALQLSYKYKLEFMTILTNGHANEFTYETLEQLQKKNINIVEAPIQEVLGIKSLKQLVGFKLANSETVDADIAFVALGIRPNNQLALQLGAEMDENGLVIADENGETSIPNIFVIGDLRAGSMKQIYTAWQQAVEVIELINQRIFDICR